MKMEIDYRCQCTPGFRIDCGCRWCSPQEIIDCMEKEIEDHSSDLDDLQGNNYSLEQDILSIKGMVKMYFDAIEIGIKDSDIKNIRERLEGLAE